MKKHTKLVVACVFGSVGMLACGSEGGSHSVETEGVSEKASAGYLTAEGEYVHDLGDTWVDGRGNMWEKMGWAEYVDDGEETTMERESPHPGRSFDEHLISVSLEEAARLLRPVMEFGHYEYRLSEMDALKLAKRVREQIAAGHQPDAEGGEPSVGEAAFADALQNPEGDREGRKVLTHGSPSEAWYRINGSAHLSPFSKLAAGYLNSSITNTHFKVYNQYTMAGAGHSHWSTSLDAWKTRKTFQFKAGSQSESGTGDELGVIPAGCYGRTVPGCYSSGEDPACDYAVVRLRGTEGEWCDFDDYNVGWLGWNSDTNVTTRLPSYPTDPPSGSWPSLFYAPDRSDSTQDGDFLVYEHDTKPGSSGSPVYRGSDQKIRAIHVRACPGSENCNEGVRVQTSMANFFIEYAGE